MDKPNISLVPETLYQFGPFNISTGHITMFAITLSIALICLYISYTAKLKPTRLQVILEGIFLWFYEKIEHAFSDKTMVRKIFPLIMTIFLVILTANIFSVIPLVEAITVGGTHLFRTPTSDVSMTLSLGLFVVVLSHLIALKKNPLGHIGNYINIKGFLKVKSFGDFAQASLDFALGLNDIIGEFAKVISISFRLFGNIFSGVAVAAVFAFLAPFIAPMPFFALGLFSGSIQAIVFSLLALTYFSGPLEALPDDK